jgi:hypothetical protein
MGCEKFHTTYGTYCNRWHLSYGWRRQGKLDCEGLVLQKSTGDKPSLLMEEGRVVDIFLSKYGYDTMAHNYYYVSLPYLGPEGHNFNSIPAKNCGLSS